jgi:chromosome segregation ATPase
MLVAGLTRQSDDSTTAETLRGRLLSEDLSFESSPIRSLEEQNSRLVRELETVTGERDGMRDAFDNVLTDLLATQSELEDEKQKRADTDVEMILLREEVARLSRSVAKKDDHHDIALTCRPSEAQTLQEQFDNLTTTEIENERAELAELRQNTHDMLAQLEAKEAELLGKTGELAEQASKLRLLENELSGQVVQAQQERQGREEAERAVQAGQQAQQTLEKDVAELQRLLAFHRTNGELVSKNARSTQAANRQLETSLRAKEAQLKEQASLIAVSNL